jgi:hypothetical protein
MRFYAKLLLMTLVFASLQKVAPPGAWGGDLWFGMRCHLAEVLHDERLKEQMVNEYYNRHHTVDDEADLNICVEIQYVKALAEEAAEAESAAQAAADAGYDVAISPG